MRRRRKPVLPQKKEDEYKINRNIRIPRIRLVGDNMEEISEAAGSKIEPEIYDTRDAQKWAQDMGLDLVEISPKADPPVCKITDYNKFLYARKKKSKEMKAKTQKTVIKEIRFGPNTDDHDFNFKLRHADKFLQEGSKVKAYVQFRGRSIVFKDRGELLLLKFIKELEEVGSAESLPKMEGRRMHVMIGPTKKKKMK
ncbi:MAG: translation initiation factor IF-3 [Saprospiraceae bacterium]